MSEQPFFTDPISYKEGGEFLQNIKDPFLLNVYKNYLGGTFKAERFLEELMKPGFSGFMFWFCLKENGELFLAWEAKFKFVYPEHDYEKVEKLEPDHGNLIIPTQTFGLDLHKVINHELYLKSHKISPPDQDGAETHIKINEFRQNFSLTKEFKNQQKYGHAYFENKKDYVQDFLSIINLSMVRYYFGYDIKYYPNYIRVILAPVDSNGANIQNKELGSSGELLQRSVPPPPNN